MGSAATAQPAETRRARWTRYPNRVTDSFSSSLGRATSAGSPSEAGQALCRLRSGHRAWALANPRQFNLIWADQLPGHAAPPTGPTVSAESSTSSDDVVNAGFNTIPPTHSTTQKTGSASIIASGTSTTP